MDRIIYETELYGHAQSPTTPVGLGMNVVYNNSISKSLDTAFGGKAFSVPLQASFGYAYELQRDSASWWPLASSVGTAIHHLIGPFFI